MSQEKRPLTSLHRWMLVVSILVVTLSHMHAPLFSQQWQKVMIDSQMKTPCDVRVADMDGDGDQDIVVSDWSVNTLLWYENAGDNVTWRRHRIGGVLYSVMGVAVADFDGDAKPDVAAACWVGGHVTWYKNNLPDSNWTESDIDSQRDQASWLEAGDIDNDGDIDILSSSNSDDKLVLYYNTGGSPIVWIKRPIHQSQGNDGAQMVLCDMDDDGMLDIVAAIKNNNRLVWLKQLQRYPYWIEHRIDSLLTKPRNPEVGDIDYDGDLDIVVGGDRGQAVVRYEHVGEGTINWNKSIIDSTLDAPGHVGMLEIDGGTEMEVVATSNK